MCSIHAHNWVCTYLGVCVCACMRVPACACIFGCLSVSLGVYVCNASKHTHFPIYLYEILLKNFQFYLEMVDS